MLVSALFLLEPQGPGISSGVLLWALVFLGEEIILFPLTQPPAAAMLVSWALSICSCEGGKGSFRHQPQSFLLRCQEGEVCVFQNVSRACVRWIEKESVPGLSAGGASAGHSGGSSHFSRAFGFSETKLQSGRRGGGRGELAKKGSLEWWCVSIFPVPGRQKQEERS